VEVGIFALKRLDVLEMLSYYQEGRPVFDGPLVGLQEVKQRQGRHLDDIHVHSDILVVGQHLQDIQTLQRKNPHFHFRAVRVLERLVSPDHLVDGEGNLLFGLEADNVGDLPFFHRRELHKPRQAGLPQHGDRHGQAHHVSAREELLQRLQHNASRIDVRFREKLRMLDEREIVHDELTVTRGVQLYGLEGTLSHVDAPYT